MPAPASRAAFARVDPANPRPRVQLFLGYQLLDDRQHEGAADMTVIRIESAGEVLAVLHFDLGVEAPALIAVHVVGSGASFHGPRSLRF
jgi:hypothetical protein